MSDLANPAIADALEELGDLYELDGAIVHRVLAYRRAAESIRQASVSVAALARAGRATELPAIGDTLQEKIAALLDTGTIPAAERLRAKFPPGLIAITRIPGIGPKRARMLYEQLQIDSPLALREAARAQRLRGVRGLGAKFEEKVLTALGELEEQGVAIEELGSPGAERAGGRAGVPLRRLLLPAAIELGETLVAGLREHGPPDAHVQLAGSARRGADSVKDIDLIATTTEPERLAAALAQLEQIERVGSTGVAGARGRAHSGVGVDLRIAAPAQLGNLLQHFTGSGPHNAALRELAVRKGLHVSEYGVLDDATATTHTCATEAEVYELLGLRYIPPELRENRGELEAATGGKERKGKGEEEGRDSGPAERGLPELIELGDIRGDLHCHTVASDGKATIEEMALAARELGYEYLAITDHSASHGFGNDVSPAQLREQVERVKEADARTDGIQLLAGSEVNIHPDGSLDYEDALLARLDWVVASIHTAFGMTEQALTERMIAAIEHPLVDAIGHPTGRLIERREPYAIDLQAVFAAAARTGTLLEINANPDRRDLHEHHARAAVAAGVRLVIDSDAHRPATLRNMRWGILTARRGWVTKQDVANTRRWAQLRGMRKRAGTL
ncbi:MAG TPA: PHP domain-containing protein [Solirubrobacteraceae bacterium]|jgi:DNA polymerase (family 10)|nr:PHP domain-containing protein [Solirubrobacteraceae bacterium]